MIILSLESKDSNESNHSKPHCWYFNWNSDYIGFSKNYLTMRILFLTHVPLTRLILDWAVISIKNSKVTVKLQNENSLWWKKILERTAFRARKHCFYLNY